MVEPRRTTSTGEFRAQTIRLAQKSELQKKRIRALVETATMLADLASHLLTGAPPPGRYATEAAIALARDTITECEVES